MTRDDKKIITYPFFIILRVNNALRAIDLLRRRKRRRRRYDTYLDTRIYISGVQVTLNLVWIPR